MVHLKWFIVIALIAETLALRSLHSPSTPHPISGTPFPSNRPAPRIRNCRARPGSHLQPASTRTSTCSSTMVDRATRLRCHLTATTPRRTRQASPTSQSITMNFTFCQSCAWKFTSTDWTFWLCSTGTAWFICFLILHLDFYSVAKCK